MTPSQINLTPDTRVILADNMDPDHGVPAMADNSVALTFTSPPYWNYIDYASDDGVGCEDSYDDYIASMGRLLNAVHRKTIPGGVLVINAANMKARRRIEGAAFVYPIVPDLIRQADAAGFVFYDEIIWAKTQMNRTAALNGRPLFGSYPYPARPKILDSTFENIMVFTKPGNRPPVCSNIKARSKISKDNWWLWTKGIWHIPPDHDPKHPATFPLQLADRVIRMYSFVGDLVLDPFAGSATTLVAAALHQRRAVGYEIAADYRAAVMAKAQRNAQPKLL